MTPSFVLFISVCAACAFLLAFVVIYPWITGSRSNDNRLMRINVDSFYERLDELEQDKQKGVIDDNFYQTQVISLKRQLLAAQNQTPMVLPSSIKSRLIVLVWIPVLCAVFYVVGADRTAIFTLWQAQDKLYQVADDLLTAKIDTPPTWATADSAALISAMQTNVHHHAYDPYRWLRLSELFMSLQATPQALESLSRAYRLASDDEEIAGTYAQVSFFANDGKLDNNAYKIVNQMLANNPRHEGAMMLLAMDKTKAGDFEQAKFWVNQLRNQIATKSGDRRAALASLDEMLVNIDQKAAALQASQVAVHVAVNKALLPKITSDDVLFVSISDVAGGAPYAVQRSSVSVLKDGQALIKLNDSHAMLPERTLSAAQKANITLVATAKISHTGNAISQSGDLVAQAVALDESRNQEIKVVIGQVVR